MVGHFVGESIREEVEHLIQIAAQLFSAIERQIHAIETDLTTTQIETSSLNGAVVFKEHLIRSATSLNATLQEITRHLGESTATPSDRAFGGRTSFGD